MANAIEFTSVEGLVKDSEVVATKDEVRKFEYKLNDKAAKGKLIKGGKRIPFEVVENSSSSNLVFNLGAWNYVVRPSFKYWSEVKGNKTCKIGDTIVRIADVKAGRDIGGKHIDTQIVFFANRDKVVLHCYNTTQLILVNGHGYAKLIQMFLKPYFEYKIQMNINEIKVFNENALSSLGSKTVKRSNVKYAGGSTHLWCTRCDFAAKSRTSLQKHKKSEHAVSFSSPSSSLAIPQHQSTRNNTLTEALMVENMTVEGILDEETVSEALKYTCLECNFKTKDKMHMDGHVKLVHTIDDMEEVNLVCGTCSHKFTKEDDFNDHVKIHDMPPIVSQTNPDKNSNVIIEDLLNDSGNDDGRQIPTLDETTKKETPASDEKESDYLECNECAWSFTEQFDLKTHMEVFHKKKDDIASKIASKVHIEECDKPAKPIEDPICVLCPFCKLQSKDLDLLRMHIENIHVRKDITEDPQDEIIIKETVKCTKCIKCEFIGSKIELDKHMKSKHKNTVICNKCGNDFPDSKTLEDHISAKHKNPSQIEPFPCESCGLVLVNFERLQEHYITYHPSMAVTCHHCEVEVRDSEELKQHIIDKHEEVFILHTIAKQVEQLSDGLEEVEPFKNELVSVLKAILQTQNEMKQELFLIRNKQSENCYKSQAPPKATKPVVETDKIHVEKANQQSKEKEKPSYASKAANMKESNSKEKEKVLFIGDSIAGNINLDVIEKAVNGKVRTAKAYSSIFDNVGTKAKAAARYPTKNFKDVVPAEIKKEPIDYLVLQSGSVDITNLNTKDKPKEYSEYYKREVRYAAKNLFEAAETAISAQPSLKKVVIMCQTPRYDERSSDPLALKRVLADLFNQTLAELWLESTFKDKLVVGIHNLECTGGIREARYRDIRDKRYQR